MANVALEVAAAVHAAVADVADVAAEPLADVSGPPADVHPADVVGDAELSLVDAVGDAAARPADIGGDVQPDPPKKDLVSQIAELKARRTMLAQQKRENARNLKNKEKRLKRVKQTLRKFDESSLKELLDLKIALKKWCAGGCVLFEP